MDCGSVKNHLATILASTVSFTDPDLRGARRRCRSGAYRRSAPRSAAHAHETERRGNEDSRAPSTRAGSHPQANAHSLGHALEAGRSRDRRGCRWSIYPRLPLDGITNASTAPVSQQGTPRPRAQRRRSCAAAPGDTATSFRGPRTRGRLRESTAFRFRTRGTRGEASAAISPKHLMFSVLSGYDAGSPEAQRLIELRDRWLNPPEWAEWVDEPVPGYPERPVPRDEDAARALKKRTLTRTSLTPGRNGSPTRTRHSMPPWRRPTAGPPTSLTTMLCASCWHSMDGSGCTGSPSSRNSHVSRKGSGGPGLFRRGRPSDSMEAVGPARRRAGRARVRRHQRGGVVRQFPSSRRRLSTPSLA